MDAFSYLSVLISIVLGLALASLLGGFAGLLRARDRVVMYWPVPAQMGLLFLIQVQLWWALFELRNVVRWSFLGFFAVLMQPVLVYLATAILVPDIPAEETLDLRCAYFREARWYFGALLLVLIDSLLRNLVVTGRLQSGFDLAGHCGFILLCIAGVVWQRDSVHKAIAPLALVMFLAYIALLFTSLPR